MNDNYEKIKTLCHQNYIGSEKCGECDGTGEKPSKPRPCLHCEGKGYVIPLEVSMTQTQLEELGMDSGYFDTKQYLKEKPLTLQDVLRLLYANDDNSDYNTWTYISGITPDSKMIIDYHDKEKKDKHIVLDLTKEPKDWSEETLQEIIDIVN